MLAMDVNDDAGCPESPRRPVVNREHARSYRGIACDLTLRFCGNEQ